MLDFPVWAQRVDIVKVVSNAGFIPPPHIELPVEKWLQIKRVNDIGHTCDRNAQTHQIIQRIHLTQKNIGIGTVNNYGLNRMSLVCQCCYCVQIRCENNSRNATKLPGSDISDISLIVCMSNQENIFYITATKFTCGKQLLGIDYRGHIYDRAVHMRPVISK